MTKLKILKKIYLYVSLLLIGILFPNFAISQNYTNWGDTTKAQTGLPISSLTIITKKGNKNFVIETASTMAQQQVGMMWRTQMKTNEGMLFDYIDNPHRASFWMENTILSLDLIFIRADGTIANIAKNAKPLDRTPIISKGIVAAVLEIKGGEADKQNIKAGDIVVHKIFGNTNLIYKKRGK